MPKLKVKKGPTESKLEQSNKVYFHLITTKILLPIPFKSTY